MSLKVEKIMLKSANFNGESSIPSIAYLRNVQSHPKFTLDEDDFLFVNYGFLDDIFPYKMQDRYDRASDEKEYLSVTLENEYLKAVFLPELGGRMWSLYDKVKGKDLLYVNDVVRPGSLSVVNAWFAGGIEYNCGMIGHSPYTCSPLFTTTTKLDDGTPVLRMYQYERIRSCVYQMDFFLPETSKVLYARMRIYNPNEDTTPMYWWTNIAVHEGKDYRNIINANDTFWHVPSIGLTKVPIPMYDGADITYPVNTKNAADYFWHTPRDKRKFTTYVNGEGYGFMQTSTSRLLGRKLFVWGQGLGSKRWQDFLSGDGKTGEYVEIQAGLGYTQSGCLPMPPKSAWEWIEVYGAIQMDPKKAHGEWDVAVKEANERVEEIISEQYLEQLLKDTRKMATTKGGELILTGGGWGALENIRREKFNLPSVSDHLDFGTVGKEQEPWLQLLNTGSFSTEITQEPPISWMKQDEWTKLIRASKPCYLKYLHLAAIYFSSRNIDSAFVNIEKALKYKKTAMSLYIYAEMLKDAGDIKGASKHIYKSCLLLKDEISLVKESLTVMNKAQDYKKIIKLYNKLSEEVKKDARVKMFYAIALYNEGKIDEAWDILHKDGGIVLIDIRECEKTLTFLYIDLVIARAKREGKIIEEKDVEVPKQFEFRMQANSLKRD